MIDAHQHFWQLDKPFDYEWLKAPQHAPINRTYLPADLRTHLDATGIAESIFVQTQHLHFLMILHQYRIQLFQYH